jgi:predicted transcriptional regulator
MKNIYPNLTSELKAQQLSFAELAKIIGMPKSTMYRRISGNTQWRLHEVLTICGTLNLYDVHYLFLRLDNIS